MLGIDPLTLVVVFSFLGLLLALVMAALRASFPRTIDGIGQWALSMPLFVIASGLFSQQQTHPLIHVTLANSLMVLAMVLMNIGLLRFYRRPLPSRRATLAAIAVIVAVLSWFTFAQPSFISRLILMSSVGAALFGHLCWLPLKMGRLTLGSGVTALAFGLTAGSCVLRMLSVLANLDRPVAFLDLSTIQAIYLSCFNVSLLIGSVGFILLLNERLRDILEFTASHDALTGVLNRGAFFRLAGAEFEQHRRQRQPMSVALVDLDHFKQINDQHGHAAGDRVLQDFCRIVKSELGPADTLGRYGGEEFVILMPGTTGSEARSFAQRLLASSQAPTPGLPAYTASIGLATLTLETANIDELLIAADDALYRAKENGRNRVED